MKKIYVIWIGGIGISGIARYYNENGYQVFGSDKVDSELIHILQKEGIYIQIGEFPEHIDATFEKVIYTEAVPKIQSELQKAIQYNIPIYTYPESLAEIANQKKLITIAWTHGKSTTTSLTSLLLKQSLFNVNALVWSLLREFWWKNVFFSSSPYFVLEACEYKRSFLQYKPYIAVITNIDLDHLDYYNDLEDYISAFQEYIWNVVSWWFVILDGECNNSKNLVWQRNDITYIMVYEDRFEYVGEQNSILYFPKITLKVPWKHIEFDAKLAFVVGIILWIWQEDMQTTLSEYNGIWRRSEYIGETLNDNILMSDYWHHPTEIRLNLHALKEFYKDKKIITIFQPHQYSRTLELLEDFKHCFGDTDILVIPDIYESRDSQEDKEKINAEQLLDMIYHDNKVFWNGFVSTLQWLLSYDKQNPWKCVFILQWAGNIDDLRYEIELKENYGIL